MGCGSSSVAPNVVNKNGASCIPISRFINYTSKKTVACQELVLAKSLYTTDDIPMQWAKGVYYFKGQYTHDLNECPPDAIQNKLRTDFKYFLQGTSDCTSRIQSRITDSRLLEIKITDTNHSIVFILKDYNGYLKEQKFRFAIDNQIINLLAFHTYEIFFSDSTIYFVNDPSSADALYKRTEENYADKHNFNKAIRRVQYNNDDSEKCEISIYYRNYNYIDYKTYIKNELMSKISEIDYITKKLELQNLNKPPFIAWGVNSQQKNSKKKSEIMNQKQNTRKNTIVNNLKDDIFRFESIKSPQNTNNTAPTNTKQKTQKPEIGNIVQSYDDLHGITSNRANILDNFAHKSRNSQIKSEIVNPKQNNNSTTHSNTIVNLPGALHNTNNTPLTNTKHKNTTAPQALTAFGRLEPLPPNAYKTTGGKRKTKAKATSSSILWPPKQSKHSKHHETSQRKIWEVNGNQCVKVMCEETRKYKFIGIY